MNEFAADLLHGVRPAPARRSFLLALAALAGGALTSRALGPDEKGGAGSSKEAGANDKGTGGKDKETGGTDKATETGKNKNDEAEVTPGEDLMQEHGILRRVLLVYEEAARRLEGGGEVDPSTVTNAAGIIRDFIENYHEKLEEEFLLPRFEAAHTEVDLVTVLRAQHQRGREVTAEVLRLAGAGSADRARLAVLLREFVRMYQPHAAREDTVLFPAFRRLVGREGYAKLGDQFEDREHQLFGENGFAQTVDKVSLLEQRLDINDLSRFTPK